MDKIDNEHLIKKFEDAVYEQTILFKDIFTRFLHKELSDTEWNKVQEISSRTFTHIIDTFAPNAENKKIKESICESVDEIIDKDR